MKLHSDFAATSRNRSTVVTGNCIESKTMHVVVDFNFVDEMIINVKLFCSVISETETVALHRLSAQRFRGCVPLADRLCPGSYVLPVEYTTASGQIMRETITVDLHRKNSLPSRCLLENVPPIRQEKPTFSGAAVTCAATEMHGQKHLGQKNVRDMVDAIRSKADYDAFQVWRIVLRRALTSQAQAFEQLPEFRD